VRIDIRTVARDGRDHRPGAAYAKIEGDAPGALPAGTRVRKCVAEGGAAHEAGDLATVLASVAVPPGLVPHWPRGGYFYAVEWDDMPGVPVHVMGYKIEKAA
jgi:hypothetical protein